MEILFENPFILVILIAIASSLFKKAKKEDDHKTNRPSMEKAPSNRKGQFQEIKDIFQEMSRTLQEEKEPSMQMKENVVQEVERKTSFVNTDSSSAENKKESMNRRPTHEQKEHERMMDEQTLVSGIILSEVLGPPRAKQSHYRQRRR